MASHSATTWKWPTGDFGIVELGDYFVADIAESRGQTALAAFGAGFPTTLSESPKAMFYLEVGERAVAARANYLACRVLGLPCVTVARAHHVNHPTEIVAVRECEPIQIGQPYRLINLRGRYSDLQAALPANVDDGLKYIVLDYCFGGHGDPALATAAGALFHTAKIEPPIMGARSSEEWLSILRTASLDGAGMAALREFAETLHVQSATIHAMIQRDEVWLDRSAIRGSAKKFASVILASIHALYAAL